MYNTPIMTKLYNMKERTVLVGNRRGGIAHVALLEDALGGGSMGRLHLIAVVAPLCAQLLGQSLVAHQISLCGLQTSPQCRNAF